MPKAWPGRIGKMGGAIQMWEKYKSAVIIAASLTLGLAVGWWLYDPAPIKAETYAASAVQADGSLILERKPDAAAKPVMQVPVGAKVERIMQIKARAKPVPVASAPDHVEQSLKMVADCPPVTVDLALVRNPDKTRRVIASSPDGEIIGGVDIPVETAAISEQTKWAAGLSYNTERRAGIWLDRDLGALRAGMVVRQSEKGTVAEARLGVRF